MPKLIRPGISTTNPNILIRRRSRREPPLKVDFGEPSLDFGEPPLEFDYEDITKTKPKLEYTRADLGKSFQKEVKMARKAMPIKIRHAARWKSTRSRIAGISAAQRYLRKKAKRRSFLKRLRGPLGLAAIMLAPTEKLPTVARGAAEAALWASKKGIPGMITAGAAAEGESTYFGKRIGELREATKAREAGAREYTKAKSWRDIRRAAFRRGIKPPQMSRAGVTPMTLEEAYDVARRVRRGR